MGDALPNVYLRSVKIAAQLSIGVVVVAACGPAAEHGAAKKPEVHPCEDRRACGADRRSVVLTTCAGASRVVQHCLGPLGCTTSTATTNVACDESIARAGDACRLEGSFGCTPEGDALTVCRGGAIVVASSCKGPQKCATGSDVTCDTSIVDAGDPCAADGKLGCSRDRTALLKCTGGTFKASETCKRQACLIGGGKALCR